MSSAVEIKGPWNHASGTVTLYADGPDGGEIEIDVECEGTYHVGGTIDASVCQARSGGMSVVLSPVLTARAIEQFSEAVSGEAARQREDLLCVDWKAGR